MDSSSNPQNPKFRSFPTRANRTGTKVRRSSSKPNLSAPATPKLGALLPPLVQNHKISPIPAKNKSQNPFSDPSQKSEFSFPTMEVNSIPNARLYPTRVGFIREATTSSATASAASAPPGPRSSLPEFTSTFQSLTADAPRFRHRNVRFFKPARARRPSPSAYLLTRRAAIGRTRFRRRRVRVAGFHVKGDEGRSSEEDRRQ